MDLLRLKNQIKNNEFDHIYIFAGDEWKVQQIYIEQMTKVIGNRVYLDSVSELVQKLSNKLFNSARTLYLLRDDKEFMTNEKAQIRTLETLSDNVLILLVSSVDKRTKFYKTYSESFVEFTTLEHAVLKRYVQKSIKLSDRNTERLMEVCENNYGRILLEIDKIKQLQEWNTAPNISADDCFEVLLNEKVIYQPPYDAVFDFVDNVLRRNTAVAFDLYEQCKAIGESTLVMLSVLYTNAKQVLQVQSCKSSDVAKSTGLTAWQIKKAREKLNRYSIGELVYMLKLIHSVEKGIKTGRMEEQYAIQYVLVNVM